MGRKTGLLTGLGCRQHTGSLFLQPLGCYNLNFILHQTWMIKFVFEHEDIMIRLCRSCNKMNVHSLYFQSCLILHSLSVRKNDISVKRARIENPRISKRSSELLCSKIRQIDKCPSLSLTLNHKRCKNEPLLAC